MSNEPFVSGYTDRAGIDSRANSALLTIESIVANRTIPAAVRLALVAQVMAMEPILTDQSPASFTVRAQTLMYRSGRKVTNV